MTAPNTNILCRYLLGSFSATETRSIVYLDLYYPISCLTRAANFRRYL